MTRARKLLTPRPANDNLPTWQSRLYLFALLCIAAAAGSYVGGLHG